MECALVNLAVSLTIVLTTHSAWAATPKAEPSNAKTTKPTFLRLARDKDNRPLGLETAVVHCSGLTEHEKKIEVDLVAAVHIADAEYYRRLNREFQTYDAVFFELVAPKNSVVRLSRSKLSGNSSAVSILQRKMKDALDLSFQLEEIDYSRKNMVHADLSPEQLAKKMEENGDTTATIFTRMAGYTLAQQGSGFIGKGQMWKALTEKNRSTSLKRVLAEQLAADGGSMSAWDGETGALLIQSRNQVVLDELRKQIDGGKRKFAVFYGAAHMPDLLDRLGRDFGLTPGETRWLRAWNLQP